MKPKKNPEELYKHAIANARHSIEELDVSVQLKSSKINPARIGAIMTGLAAVLILGWMLIQPRITQHKIDEIHANVAEISTPPGLINGEGEIISVERFNQKVKSISASNETIQRFNSKLKKFSKSNT